MVVFLRHERASRRRIAIFKDSAKGEGARLKSVVCSPSWPRIGRRQVIEHDYQ